MLVPTRHLPPVDGASVGECLEGPGPPGVRPHAHSRVVEISQDGPRRHDEWASDMKRVRDSAFGHSPLTIAERLSRRRRYFAESGRYPQALTKHQCWTGQGRTQRRTRRLRMGVSRFRRRCVGVHRRRWCSCRPAGERSWSGAHRRDRRMAAQERRRTRIRTCYGRADGTHFRASQNCVQTLVSMGMTLSVRYCNERRRMAREPQVVRAPYRRLSAAS
jgi:hypothetical protein